MGLCVLVFSLSLHYYHSLFERTAKALASKSPYTEIFTEDKIVDLWDR